MTADQVKGKGFKGALGYNLDKVEKGKANVLTSTFNQDKDPKAILKEVNLVRMQRPNLAKYFYHTSLNFPVSENLPDKQMQQIAGDYLKAMGFGDNQHIMFRHFDADHPHLHILVNRIGYDGSVVSDSQDYKRSERALRKLEKQYGLTEVISSKEAKERAMTKNELEMMKRTNEPSAKMKVQEMVKQAIKDKPDIQKFIQRLEQGGVNVLFNQASTGFVSGISYGYDGLQFKEAQLGNAYKWQAIKGATGYEQERDRTAVHEANVRTRKFKAERAATTGAGNGADERRAGTIQSQTRTRNQTTGTRTDTSLAENGTAALSPLADSLQRQLQQGGGQKAGQAVKDGNGSNQSRIADESNRGHGRAATQAAEQGRQPVADQNLPDSHLIGHLLGTNNDVGRMADTEMNNNPRRRKKKRRGLSR